MPTTHQHPTVATLKHAVMGLCFAAVAVLLAPRVDAQAHPHQGTLPKIIGAPKLTPLSDQELATLAAGKAVRKQVKEKSGGRGVVVQDIAAQPSVVWGRILDFNRYPKVVDNVKETSIYEKSGDHIKTRFVIGGFGLSLEYFIDHIYRPKENYLSWTLDYTKKSGLDDSVGYWVVLPHPTVPGHTRLYYSVRVIAGAFVPGFVEDMIADNGLVNATAWVKSESEAAQRRKDAEKDAP